MGCSELSTVLVPYTPPWNRNKKEMATFPLHLPSPTVAASAVNITGTQREENPHQSDQKGFLQRPGGSKAGFINKRKKRVRESTHMRKQEKCKRPAGHPSPVGHNLHISFLLTGPTKTWAFRCRLPPPLLGNVAEGGIWFSSLFFFSPLSLF